MKVINTRHIERSIEFMAEKAAEYNELAASYERQGLEHLAGWYEGRAGAFESAVHYLQTDIDVFAEEAAQ